MIKNQVAQLLQKEMDRKDFLKHVGIAAAVMVGIPTILKTLSQLQSTGRPESLSTGTHLGSATKYGASVYGGRRL